MFDRIGETLLGLAGRTRDAAFLAAPFAKKDVVERLLDTLSAGVAVTLVTRWRPEEIAAGVSDLEVFDLLRSGGHELRLLDHLHAKYYRFDETVVIGSANLTRRALGWARTSNLELVEPPRNCSEDDQRFEQLLLSGSWHPSRHYREEMESLSTQLADETANFDPDLVLCEALASTWTERFDPDDGPWFPACRHPESLEAAYEGRTAVLTSSGSATAVRDLASLSVPRGLSMPAFRQFVRCALLRHELVRELEIRLGISSLRFGEFRDRCAEWLRVKQIVRDANDAAQVLQRWLVHFCPQRFRMRTARYSEILFLVSDQGSEDSRAPSSPHRDRWSPPS